MFDKETLLKFDKIMAVFDIQRTMHRDIFL